MASALLTSCVSKKKYAALDANLKNIETAKKDCEDKFAKGLTSLKKSKDDAKGLQVEVDSLKQIVDSKGTGNSGGVLLNTLKNMSVLTAEQASSIEQSLKSIEGNGENNMALNTALVTNIKDALGVANDTDIIVQSDKGNLYIDMSDHMFFNSGSSDLTPRAKTIISKVAKILNAHPDMQFMVEGHTDNKPMHGTCVPDNWDLSIRRATAVVRILQKEHQVNPSRMLAAGHGEYAPIQANDTPAHRAQNRRISIVMMPQMDQFFKLLVKK